MSDDPPADTVDRRVCLDLFAGLGGLSAAFVESDRWDVVTVDLEERFDPDIQADVMDLRPSELPDDFDVVLAGHPCTVFSKAAAWQEHWDENGDPQTEKAKQHVAMLFHTVGLIRALAPEFWFIENPEGHMRRFLGQPTGSVTYCQYGEDYRKPTDLWGDHPPMTYRRCSNGDDCHDSRRRREKAGDEHPSDTLPRDPAERAKVPYELSKSILDAVEGRGEQSTLPVMTDGGDRQNSKEVEQDEYECPNEDCEYVGPGDCRDSNERESEDQTFVEDPDHKPADRVGLEDIGIGVEDEI